MARPSDPQILTQQALLALDQSRAALSTQWARTQQQWNPGRLLHDGVEKYRLAILLATAAAGFAAFRWIIPSFMGGRDSTAKPARKRTFTSFLLNGLWGQWREPLLAIATQQFAPAIFKFLSTLQSPPKPPPSE